MTAVAPDYYICIVSWSCAPDDRPDDALGALKEKTVDALDTSGACARRWYVFAPILILAVVGGYGLSGSRPSTYTCTGGIAVIPPITPATSSTAAADPAQTNPLAQAGGSALFEQALATELSSKVEEAQLAPPHSDVTFTVSASPNSGLLTVVGTGDDESQVTGAVNRVMALVPTRLSAIQQAARAPAASMYRAAVVDKPTVSQIAPPSKLKLIGAFAVVGLLVGTASALLVDRKIGRRKHEPPAGPTPTGPAADHPADPVPPPIEST
jgi:hypothetical protein